MGHGLISDEFKSILLDKKTTERDVMRFLKGYPYVLVQLFNKSWNKYRIFPEFRMGSDFRADFVIISADSGAWHGRFIELEGPNDSPYTKAGTPRKKLNWAVRQTNDWRDFTWAHKVNLMHEFAKLIRPLGWPAQNNLMGQNVSAHVELEHPNTFIDFDYHIIIGNSRDFSDSDRKAHRHYSGNNVVTYDRVYNTMCEFESRFETFKEQQKALANTGH